MAERGKYIVIEGGDGTGKTTQARRIDQGLRAAGFDTLHVINPDTGEFEPIQEPGGTPEADILRRKIKDASIPRTPWQNVEWFTDSRVLSYNQAIEPALESGLWVVCARNWLSTIAYQGYGEGISLDAIEEYTRTHVGEAYMTPDLLVILTLRSEAKRRQRMGSRDDRSKLDTFESKDDNFQSNMQDGYTRYGMLKGLDLQDASGTEDEIFSALWKRVERLIEIK